MLIVQELAKKVVSKLIVLLLKDFISKCKESRIFFRIFCYLLTKKVVFFVKVNISKLVR